MLTSTFRLGSPVLAKAALCVLALSSVAAANQIVNGDFSSGNSSFNSGYVFDPANGTVHTEPGQYSVTMNPGTQFTNGYNSYTDHTGDAAGLMLLVDGYAPGTNAWSQSVSVSPATTYTFTGWVASADNENLATLGLFVNGAQVGSSVAAPSNAGVWTEWQQTITTGPSDSTITLSIQDLNTNYFTAGNDFTLDDLSLTAASTPPTSGVPEPATFASAGLAALCGWLFLRRTRRA